MDPLSIGLAILSVAGTAGTFYYGIKSNRLERERRKLSWDDLTVAALDLAQKVTKEFQPDLIYALSARGTAVSLMALPELGCNLPLYVGLAEDEKHHKFCFRPDAFEQLKTTKWTLHVPVALFCNSKRKVLVVDDFVMSGDSLKAVVDLLVSKGFDQQNIKTAAIVSTRVAADAGKAPNFTWLNVPDANFYFPWGKAS